MGDPYISLNLPLRTGIIGFLEGIVSLIHHLLVRSRAEDYELLEEWDSHLTVVLLKVIADVHPLQKMLLNLP